MKIEKNINLSEYTTFRTGGPARYFSHINTSEELLEVSKWINENNLEYFCLGGGSNILFNDSGYDGIIIKLENTGVIWDKNKCSAGAAIFLAALCNEAKKNNLSGLEWGSGIPASLGGAIRNNAGAYGYELRNLVKIVEYFDFKELKFKEISTNDCKFSYRKSIFQNHRDWIIWKANLVWEKGDFNEIQKRILHYLEKRRQAQPLEFPSAGSFFKNPSIENLNKEAKNKLIENFIQSSLKNVPEKKIKEVKSDIEKKILLTQTIPAGYLIEKAGLKGRIIGKAQVSPKHANFIINLGGATTENIIMLASIIKQKVRSNFGIQLHEEVEYVGF